jgi:hypothetical protein
MDIFRLLSALSDGPIHKSQNASESIKSNSKYHNIILLFFIRSARVSERFGFFRLISLRFLRFVGSSKYRDLESRREFAENQEKYEIQLGF